MYPCRDDRSVGTEKNGSNSHPFHFNDYQDFIRHSGIPARWFQIRKNGVLWNGLTYTAISYWREAGDAAARATFLALIYAVYAAPYI